MGGGCPPPWGGSDLDKKPGGGPSPNWSSIHFFCHSGEEDSGNRLGPEFSAGQPPGGAMGAPSALPMAVWSTSWSSRCLRASVSGGPGAAGEECGRWGGVSCTRKQVGGGGCFRIEERIPENRNVKSTYPLRKSES